jgi:predicted N-acetyltransferase YhbS
MLTIQTEQQEDIPLVRTVNEQAFRQTTEAGH